MGAGVLFVGGIVVACAGVDRLRRQAKRPARTMAAVAVIAAGLAMCLSAVALVALLG